MKRGHTAVVVEQSPGVRAEGYMVDFFGLRLRCCGDPRLLPASRGRIHYPVSRLVFVDERGRECFSLGYPALRERWFGGRHFNFLRGNLEELLHAHVKDRVAVRFGMTVASFEARPPMD